VSIVTLSDFKAYLRELTNDLDTPLTAALASANAEVTHRLGYDPAEEHGTDMLLASVHADAADVPQLEYRRTAAYRLLDPWRLTTGFGGAA
jgi:hypothetical protein